MKQLIYIASTGYSGTTLLDMLLNNHPRVTALGEIYLLSSYAKNNDGCTCGERIRSCKFWNRVERALKESLDDPSLDLSFYPLTVEEKIQSINRIIPTLNDLLLLLGNKRLWRICSVLTSVSRKYLQAANNAINLFQVISEIEDTPVLVDSSKYALPLKVLYLSAPWPVKIIFMVRDGRAVCRSLRQRKNMSYEEAVFHWVRFNQNLKLIMKTIPKDKIKLVRYEDLCNEPDKELNSIFGFIKLDTPKNKILNKTNYHNIGGNPMRFRRDELIIRLDEKWKNELTVDETRIFEKVAGKMNRSFGYM